MKLTKDEIKTKVADGERLARLIGAYNTPCGKAEVAAEKKGEGWGAVRMTMTLADGKKMDPVPVDILEHNIAAGKMTKIE